MDEDGWVSGYRLFRRIVIILPRACCDRVKIPKSVGFENESFAIMKIGGISPVPEIGTFRGVADQSGQIDLSVRQQLRVAIRPVFPYHAYQSNRREEAGCVGKVGRATARIRSRKSDGVSIVSKATVPTTKSDICNSIRTVAVLSRKRNRANVIQQPEQFRPPWYLRNGHVQTILTGFFKPKPPLLPTIEHFVPMGDKGASLVFENRAGRPATQRRDEAVLLLHGLGFSHAGTYMTTTAHWLLARGIRVFRADLPGAGPSGRFTPLPPHGACFEEIWGMLIHLRDKLGIRRWRLSGISLGGNILLKLLASKHLGIDAGDGSRELSVLRAISVAPPIRLSDCSTHMEKGVYRLYASYFMGALRKQAKVRAAIWPQWEKQLRHASFETIRKFDETMTAPLAGFRDAEEYYSAGSAAAWLDQIQVPTMILIDQHDPIVPAWMFDNVVLSNSTVLRRTEFGGHVGYMHRCYPPRLLEDAGTGVRKLNRWADPWIADELLK